MFVVSARWAFANILQRKEGCPGAAFPSLPGRAATPPRRTLHPRGPPWLFGKHDRSSVAGQREILGGHWVCKSRNGTREGRRHPNHTQPGHLVYASRTAPPAGPGTWPQPRPSLPRVAPPAPPALLFASFGVTRSLSGLLSGSFRPSPPPYLPNSPGSCLDWLASSVMSRRASSVQRGCRPRSSVTGVEREARPNWALFFVAEAAAAVDISRRGEVLYVQDGGAL